jgi:predicted phage terminase large subunit-like protein
VDLAYTAKTSSDYSVVVTLAADDSFYYILDVVRQQVRAPQFGVTLGGARGRFPFAPMSWYCIATEQGVADLLNALNPKIRVQAVPTTHDKFVRAQPVAAAWNEGKVLVPRDAPWLDPFVTELAAFTGVNDAHDDQVDALAAAFDLLKNGAPIAVAVGGQRTWARAGADL